MPVHVRPLEDTATLTVEPLLEQVGVAKEPSLKAIIEKKYPAVPLLQLHPVTEAGVYVVAPEAAKVTV